MLTIERSAVEAALAADFIYQTDDGRFLTFDEACDELTPAMAAGLDGLPPAEQVIDGGDVEEFIFESGVFGRIEVEARIITQYTDGHACWTSDQLREQIFPSSDRSDVNFAAWLAAEISAGSLTAVDVLQYVGYESEDADHETVITERLIRG